MYNVSGVDGGEMSAGRQHTASVVVDVTVRDVNNKPPFFPSYDVIRCGMTSSGAVPDVRCQTEIFLIGCPRGSMGQLRDPLSDLYTRPCECAAHVLAHSRLSRASVISFVNIHCKTQPLRAAYAP